MKRVADLLVDTVVAAGVERVYGLAGDSLNGITDSIRPGIILSGFSAA
jgi:pyruvate dehydrogenase (quinone)